VKGMDEEDAFRSLLGREPALMEWLLEEAREEARGRDAVALAARGMVPGAVCLSADAGDMAFDIPIASDAPAPVELIIERMHELNISLRRTPREILAHDETAAADGAALDVEVRKYCGGDPRNSDLVSSFYLPQRTAAEHWVLGTVVNSERSVAGILMVLGMLSCDADPSLYEVAMTRFLASRLTGELFEVSLARNGMVVVWRDSHLMSRFEAAVYGPGRSLAELGPLLRRGTFASMLDCVKCCSLSDGRVSRSNFALCRCVNPTHPVVTRPFDTWDDMATMCVSTMRDGITLKTVYDGSGTLVMRSVAHFTARFVKTTCDALPLFSALILSQTFVKPHTALSNAAEEGRTLLLKLTENDVENTASTNSATGSDLSLSCSQCERRFSSRYNLIRHVQSIHQNARAFECELCGQRFKLKNHLQVHVRLVHMREQPYTCEQCARRFATASNLRRHVLEAHLKTRDFTCELCPRRFTNKFNLTRHIARLHAAELQPASDQNPLIFSELLSPPRAAHASR